MHVQQPSLNICNTARLGYHGDIAVISEIHDNKYKIYISNNVYERAKTMLKWLVANRSKTTINIFP